MLAMKGRHPRKLHETPPEFAKAKEVQTYRWWQDEQERHLRWAKRDREYMMPSHWPPSPRCVCWGMGQPAYYESDASYRRRYEKWAKRFLKKGSHHSSTE